MLKMSGSLCSLLDTVYRSPICRRLITRLPPRSSCEGGQHLHGRGEEFDFHKTWSGAKLTRAIFAALTESNRKGNWPPQRCKWAVSFSACNPCCTASSGYCCCCIHSDKTEFNYFYTWNTPMVISVGLQHEPVGARGKKERFLVCSIPRMSKMCTFIARVHSNARLFVSMLIAGAVS